MSDSDHSLAVLTASGSQTWRTPPWVIPALETRGWRFLLDASAMPGDLQRGSLMGHLDFLGPGHPDPARRDALRVCWGDYLDRDLIASMVGRGLVPAVWLNPPYDKCEEFLGHAAIQAEKHGVHVVSLVYAKTESLWWSRTVEGRVSEKEFIRGRLSFERSNHDPDRAKGSTSATQGSVLLTYRPCWLGGEVSRYTDRDALKALVA